jgi:glycosyltransferase involved in cell wall biosynthesis
VVGHPLVSEIIVVDDGSTDGTADIVKTFPTVTLLVQKKNAGKSAAIASGIRAAKTSEWLLLLDSDLLGLTANDITALIDPLQEGYAEVSISLRGNAPSLWRAIGLDYISGERVLSRTLLLPHLDVIQALSSFALEVFINSLIIKAGCRLAIIPWTKVVSPFKHTKHGIVKGVAGDLYMMYHIFSAVGFIEPIRQIITMLKRRVSKPLFISFVVPAYNEQEHIGACIGSILAAAQEDGARFELIVVNNASTDRTRAIAESYPHVIVVDEPRKGVTFARQAGLERASGELVANLDADTLLPLSW